MAAAKPALPEHWPHLLFSDRVFRYVLARLWRAFLFCVGHTPKNPFGDVLADQVSLICGFDFCRWFGHETQ